MSFCSNCGTELTEGTAFCPNCGAGQLPQFDTPEQPIPASAPEVINAEPVCQEPEVVQPAPVYEQPVYRQTVEPASDALTGPAKIFSIISMACGIASIPLCCCGPVFGIAAIVFSILSRKKTPAGVKNTMATVGLITGIIGTVLGAIMGTTSFISGLINGFSEASGSFDYMSF